MKIKKDQNVGWITLLQDIIVHYYFYRYSNVLDISRNLEIKFNFFLADNYCKSKIVFSDVVSTFELLQGVTIRRSSKCDK